MGITVDDPRSPLAVPRRRRSLRRRVAELERLVAEMKAVEADGWRVHHDMLTNHGLRLTAVEVEAVRLDDLPRWVTGEHRPVDHEPAVERLLTGEPEAAARRTGSPS